MRERVPQEQGGALSELRDALDDAIRHAYCEGSWMFAGVRVPPEEVAADLVQDPGKMRHLIAIQTAAWDAVKERVE